MECQGKKVMVLGGAGLVGQAICRELLQNDIETLIVTSLRKHEAEECIKGLEKLFPTSNTKYIPLWGDMFAPLDLKDSSRDERIADVKQRSRLTDLLLHQFSDATLEQSTLYHWCSKHKPNILIDCVNSATALAYKDVYSAASDLRGTLKNSTDHEALTDAAEKLLLSMPTPQLIRHVQILWESMQRAKTEFYLKIGTSGTGGMGITMPYTHSEGKSAQLILSKAAVAGAHTLLLFLMARTPGGPIVKELKPAAYIAWKRIGFGPVLHRGEPLLLEDCPLERAVDLHEGAMKRGSEWEPTYLRDDKNDIRAYEAPFIDTGENGMWGMDEFALVTDASQMEFITPEEIAKIAASEIKGRNTGHDIVAALDNSTLGPTYRAGFMRKTALDRMQQLAEEHGVDSVAFEMSGPFSAKLLYEAYLLARAFPTCEAVKNASVEDIVKATESAVTTNSDLRARILSIGLPILLPNSKLMRGKMVHIPSGTQRAQHPDPTADDFNQWAAEGWVDLRATNWKKWKERIHKILDQIDQIDPSDTSSYNAQGRRYWKSNPDGCHPIEISKLVSWIFREEEEGERMKD